MRIGRKQKFCIDENVHVGYIWSKLQANLLLVGIFFLWGVDDVAVVAVPAIDKENMLLLLIYIFVNIYVVLGETFAYPLYWGGAFFFFLNSWYYFERLAQVVK